MPAARDGFPALPPWLTALRAGACLALPTCAVPAQLCAAAARQPRPAARGVGGGEGFALCCCACLLPCCRTAFARTLARASPPFSCLSDARWWRRGGGGEGYAAAARGRPAGAGLGGRLSGRFCVLEPVAGGAGLAYCSLFFLLAFSHGLPCPACGTLLLVPGARCSRGGLLQGWAAILLATHSGRCPCMPWSYWRPFRIFHGTLPPVVAACLTVRPAPQ